VYAAAAMEYVLSEVCEVSQEAAKANGRYMIRPRHITLGIRHDEELSILFNGHIPEGGVVANINPILFPNANGSKGKSGK
jgi:histone H2A